MLVVVCARRFPPPWAAEENRRLQALAYVYFEDQPGRRAAAKLLTRDESRRIAANIAKVLEVLRQSRTASSLSEAKGSTGATCGVAGSEFCETVIGGPAFFFSNASANIRISSRHSRMSEVFTVSPQPDQLPQGFLALFLRAWDGPPLPARPWSVEETDPEARAGGAFIVRDANRHSSRG
jgi:hypothetical protein